MTEGVKYVTGFLLHTFSPEVMDSFWGYGLIIYFGEYWKSRNIGLLSHIYHTFIGSSLEELPCYWRQREASCFWGIL